VNETTVVHKVEIPDAILRKMTKRDRAIFLVAGHIANELTTLSKLVLIVAQSSKVGTDLEKYTTASQQLTLLKLMILKLVEGLDLGRKSLATPALKQALREPKSRLRSLWVSLQNTLNSGRLNHIRKKLSAHYDLKEFEKFSEAKFRDDAQFIYLTHQTLNSFYSLSEEAMFRVLIQAGTSDKSESDFDKIFDECIDGVGDLLLFLQQVMIYLLKHYGMRDLEGTKIVQSVSDVRSLRLPFFLDVTALRVGSASVTSN
jgi:hypothetical protein